MEHRPQEPLSPICGRTARRSLDAAFFIFRKPAYALAAVLLFSTAAGAIDYAALDIPGGNIRSIVQAPSDPRIMYAASQEVYKSTDGGATWARKPFPKPSPDLTGFFSSFPHRNASSLAVNLTDPDIVVAGDQDSTPLWMTDDGGNSWTSIALGSDEGPNAKTTTLVAASLVDAAPNTYFAAVRATPAGGSAGNQTLYRIRDNENAWTPLTTASLPTISGSRTITSITFFRPPVGASSELVVTIADGFMVPDSTGPVPITGSVHYSTDQGGSFTPMTFNGSPLLKAINSVALDTNQDLLWAIDTEGTLYSAVFAQNTWFKDETLPVLPKPFKYRVSFLKNANLLIVSADTDTAHSGLVYFKDLSDIVNNPWNFLSLPTNGEMSGFLTDLVVSSDPATGFSVTAGTTRGGIYHSIGSWTSFSRSTGITSANVSYIANDLGAGNIFAATADHQVFRSTDTGATWAGVFAGSGSDDIPNFVTLMATDTRRAFITSGTQLRITEADAGGAPVLLHDFTADGATRLSNLLIDPSDALTMYIGADNGIFKTTDGGTTWTSASPDLAALEVRRLEFDPSASTVLFAGTNDGLFKSTDAAASWLSLDLPGGALDTIAVTSDTNTFWTGGTFSGVQRVYVTKNGGASWSIQTVNGSDVSSSRVFSFGPSQFLGTSDGNIYKSDTAGTAWEQVMGFPAGIRWVVPISSGGTTTGNILAATGEGLFRITDIAAVRASTAVTSSSDPVIRMYNYPNPFDPSTGGETTIKMTVLRNRAENCALRIYTVAGNLVREIPIGTLTEGDVVYPTWNGRNRNNNLCAPGLYVAVLSAGSTRTRFNIVISY